MITLFTSCKPFIGADNVAQRNAIKSWRLLRPKPEVIIVGDDSGAKEVAEEFGLIYISEVRRYRNRNPYVDDVFKRASQAASNDLLCYLNSDIILMSDYMSAVNEVRVLNKQFLIIGKRYDLNVENELDFGSQWEEQLTARVKSEGCLYPLAGIDYFVFRKGTYDDIPPYILGNVRWDNWMVYSARCKRMMVVDATDHVRVVHQNHELNHAQGADEEEISTDEAAVYNFNLYGKDLPPFYHVDATHKITLNGLKRSMDRSFLVRCLTTLPILLKNKS
ncbi:MAG: glycosyltransferase family 2 protein [Desulfuromonadales bacterium]|nr:glycosyltransferase family 2 protein [Desulfuromonadales bacterium]